MASLFRFGSLLLATVSVVMAQQYTARLITMPQGGAFSATAINDSSQVAGYYTSPGSNTTYPAILSPDGFIDLPSPATGAVALGINAAGVTVGGTTSNSGTGGYGVIWPNQIQTFIPPPSGFSWITSGGIAINDTGVVLGTGTYFDGDFEGGPFLSNGGDPSCRHQRDRTCDLPRCGP